MKRVVTILALVLAPVSIRGDQGAVYGGIGGMQCAGWLKLAADDSLVRDSTNYMMGFQAAATMVARRSDVKLDSFNTTKARMRVLCADHPDFDIDMVGMRIWGEKSAPR